MGNGPTPVSEYKQRILYDGVDQPLWLYDAENRVSLYFEQDTLGNVRRLRGGKYAGDDAETRPPLPSDLGGYEYLAFGKLVSGTAAPEAPKVPNAQGTPVAFNQPLRWQARPFIDKAGGVYDFRARFWSPETATFLEPDEYGYLERPGTLWSWPRQNPFRWRDPSGRDGWDTFSTAALYAGNAAAGIAEAASALAASPWAVASS